MPNVSDHQWPPVQGLLLAQSWPLVHRLVGLPSYDFRLSMKLISSSNPEATPITRHTTPNRYLAHCLNCYLLAFVAGVAVRQELQGGAL